LLLAIRGTINSFISLGKESQEAVAGGGACMQSIRLEKNMLNAKTLLLKFNALLPLA
jgi:hypothetical protein